MKSLSEYINESSLKTEDDFDKLHIALETTKYSIKEIQSHKDEYKVLKYLIENSFKPVKENIFFTMEISITNDGDLQAYIMRSDEQSNDDYSIYICISKNIKTDLDNAYIIIDDSGAGRNGYRGNLNFWAKQLIHYRDLYLNRVLIKPCGYNLAKSKKYTVEVDYEVPDYLHEKPETELTANLPEIIDYLLHTKCKFINVKCKDEKLQSIFRFYYKSLSEHQRELFYYQHFNAW